MDKISEELNTYELVDQDLEQDDSEDPKEYIKPFNTEDEIMDFYIDIKQQCEEYNPKILANLQSMDLLLFLHPGHNPVF